jgi:hypothetical protein
MHMGIMLQPDSIIRCKQAQQNNCRLAHTADYYPLFCFFAMHMGIMLQPEGTLRCKQAQHNNCRLAHTALLPFFVFLQCTWESCCNQRAPYVANKRDNSQPPKLSQHPTQNTDNETSNHPGSMGFATRSLQTNSKLNSRNEFLTFPCVIFFLYRDEQLRRIRRDH